jgi:hypothetical protein
VEDHAGDDDPDRCHRVADVPGLVLSGNGHQLSDGRGDLGDR